MIGAFISKFGRQSENPAFSFLRARIKLIWLKIIVSFKTQMDTGVGDKIEFEEHRFIIREKNGCLSLYLPKSCYPLLKSMVLKNKYFFFGKQVSLTFWKQKPFMSFYT